MQNDEQQLKKRFTELSDRADLRGCPSYSDFLNIDEQDILSRTKALVPVSLFGGYETSERRIAGFGIKGLSKLKEDFPITCISIEPVSQKFADILSHRDFLGSLIALGLRREVLGDILIHDNCGYLFCLDSISDYILDQLTKVRHTNVICSRVDSPPIETMALPPKIELIASSERLDVLVAAVYKLSRNDSQRLFTQKKIFVGSRMTENTSHQLRSGDTISVRGFGRFIYEGIERETKKGRLIVTVRVF